MCTMHASRRALHGTSHYHDMEIMVIWLNIFANSVKSLVFRVDLGTAWALQLVSDMTRRPLPIRALFIGLFLMACDPVELSTTDTFPLRAEPLVVKVEPDAQAEIHSYSLTMQKAPAGEYLVFVGTTAPSTLEGLASFDPERDCANAIDDCEVPGIGAYAARSMLSDIGPTSLKVSTSKTHLIVVRRGNPWVLSIPVEVTARTRGGDGGCIQEANPPTLTRLSK
jgi:hypothetical protein